MLKRFRWLAVLGITTVILWIVSGIILSVVGNFLYKLPEPRGVAQLSDAQQEQKARGLDYYDVITERDLMHLAARPAGSGNKIPNGENVQLPLIEMGLTLRGTIAGFDEIARAIIESQGKQALYKIGDRIQGAEIVAIFRNKVVFDVNGQEQMLVVKETQSKAGRSSSARTASRPQRSAPSDMSGMNNIMQNLDKHIGRARVSPYFKGGEPYGFRVSNVSRSSTIYELGIRSGDIIKTVNGVSIKTPEEAMAAYQELQSESSVSVEFERRGVPQTIDVPLAELMQQ